MSHGLDIPLPHWNKINISILTHAWTTLVRRGICQMVTPVKFLKFEFYPRKVCMWISIVSATNWAWRMFCTCIWHQSWVFLLQYTHIQTSSSCFTQKEHLFAPILVNFYPSPKEFYTSTVLVTKSTSDLDARMRISLECQPLQLVGAGNLASFPEFEYWREKDSAST